MDLMVIEALCHVVIRAIVGIVVVWAVLPILLELRQLPATRAYPSAQAAVPWGRGCVCPGGQARRRERRSQHGLHAPGCTALYTQDVNRRRGGLRRHHHATRSHCQGDGEVGAQLIVGVFASRPNRILYPPSLSGRKGDGRRAASNLEDATAMHEGSVKHKAAIVFSLEWHVEMPFKVLSKEVAPLLQRKPAQRVRVVMQVQPIEVARQTQPMLVATHRVFPLLSTMSPTGLLVSSQSQPSTEAARP